MVVIDDNDINNGNPLIDTGDGDSGDASGEGWVWWEGIRELPAEDAVAAAALAAYFCFMM